MSAVKFLLLIAVLLSSCDGRSPNAPEFVSPPTQPELRVGISHFAPKGITMVQPRLPADAKRLGVNGPVLLEIKIDKTGSVADVRVVQGHPTLNDVAENAVKHWKYEPPSFEGEPIAVWTTVTVNFT